MAVAHSNDGRRGLGTLLRDLAEGSAELVRGEVRLARIELGGAAGAAAKGTAYTAVGGVLLLLGTLAVFTGLINKLFLVSFHAGNMRRRFKNWNRTAYRATKLALVVGAVAFVVWI